MGISLKLAPGIRIRASSRGLRASVGPRAARVHFGSGRTGVSSGFGPLGVYGSLGSSRRASQARPTQPTLRELERATQARLLAEVDLEKLSAAKHLSDTVMAILKLHEAEFPPATKPTAQLPPVPDLAALEQGFVAQAVRGLSIFDRRGRGQAEARAKQCAQWEHHRLVMEAREQAGEVQRSLNEEWDRLLGNDPDTVMEVLARALDDNAAAAAPLGVEGNAASLVVHVPTSDMAPEEVPVVNGTFTSLRSLTLQERATYYKLLVCGYVLVTIKEAFAVAPAITSISIVAVRHVRTDSYGREECEAVLTAGIERNRLHGVRWSEATACDVLYDASSELLFKESGYALELQALDPHEYPEIAPALAVIDLSEPVGDEPAEDRVAQPEAPAPTTYEPPSVQPPRWCPDPTGRHRLRYWDGIAWTVHVTDGDEVQQDPIS